MKLTEKQKDEIQRRAYENRECIQPRDTVVMICTEADDEDCQFKLKSGDVLWCEQPVNKLTGEPMEKIVKGEKIRMWCSEVIVASNGRGRFVDYRFKPERMWNTVLINGPDAQALEVIKRFDWDNYR